MISTLVADNGKWGAYVATDRQLEQKEQPFYLAPFERPSEAVEAIEECWQGQFLGFTDYGSFWEQVVNAGIEKPETMPHRENKELYPKETWKMSRVKTCLVCKQVV